MARVTVEGGKELEVNASREEMVSSYITEIERLDKRRKTNTLATRFSAAYGAAFWLARASIEAAGYRLAGSEGHRTMVFQCLAHTVEWETDRWRRLDDIHRLRNRFDNGDIIDVSEAQVETAIADAQALLDDVLSTFPTLKPR